MSSHKNEYVGFEELEEELKDFIKKVEKPQEILEIGAKEYVSDLLKLAKPISKIRKSGYTHLIETFTYEKVKNNEINVGWGKYYGRMVENGTKKTSSQPHMKPLWEKNKERYYKLMINKLYN